MQTEGIENVGGLNVGLLGSLALAWLIVAIVLIRGIKSLGKVCQTYRLFLELRFYSQYTNIYVISAICVISATLCMQSRSKSRYKYFIRHPFPDNREFLASLAHF